MILGLTAPLKGAPGGASLTCDAALAALFTPPRPSMGRYEVCTTPDPIDRVVAARRAGAPDSGPDGVHFGIVEALDPLDAFGAAGPYNRSALARLYGGTRARVVRGWRRDGDGLVSITLVSPFPDAALARLHAGTMEIRLTLP